MHTGLFTVRGKKAKRQEEARRVVGSCTMGIRKEANQQEGRSHNQIFLS